VNGEGAAQRIDAVLQPDQPRAGLLRSIGQQPRAWRQSTARAAAPGAPPTPEDRRRHLVELTDAGVQQLTKAECALAAAEDEVEAGPTQAQLGSARRSEDPKR
jgi:hypothetical protein